MKTFVAQNKRRGLAVLVSDLYDPSGFERGSTSSATTSSIRSSSTSSTRGGEAEAARRRALYDCETGDEREVTVTAKVLERFGEAHQA
jgi:hypothetical protein